MIRYYAGVEGSGKTCMMTRDLYRHYMSGGRVLSFPGYELYGRTKKQVLSEAMMPEQILELVDTDNIKELRKQKIAIGIDEITNYFNHHNWYNKICDIFRVVMEQRRKTNAILLMTGPQFEVLPPDIRTMIHEIVRCWDAHVFNRKVIPSGVWCKYTKEDRRGLLSHPKYRFSRRLKFFMKPWHKYYDTYSTTNPINMFRTLKFQKKEILIGLDGKPIVTPEVDPSTFDGILTKYQPVEDPRITNVRKVLTYLKNKGIEIIDQEIIREMIPGNDLTGPVGIGTLFKQFGVLYKKNEKLYDLSGVEL